jgi:sugar phosphate isomerase/epimerase
MQFGFSIRFLSMKPDVDVLDAVGSTRGLASIELCPDLFDDDEKGRRKAAMKSMLKRSGIRTDTVHGRFGAQYDISSLDETTHLNAIREAEATIALAVEFGSSIIVYHSSFEPIADGDRNDRIAQAKRSLAHLGGVCQKAGKRIAVEFLPRTGLGRSLEELMELIDNGRNRNLGICLDVNHVMTHHRELPEYVRRLGDRLLELHLSDYDGGEEKHWQPGKGVVDWKALMSSLRQAGFSGPLTLECPLDGATLQEKIRSLETTIEYLGGL